MHNTVLKTQSEKAFILDNSKYMMVWKRKTKETLKRPRIGGQGMNNRAQKIFRAVKIFCMKS